MAIDSTYTFFKREFDDDHKKGSLAPVINVSRVVRRGGLRGASVPPIHLGAKASRPGSIASSRGVSVARTTGFGHASAGSHRPVSIALHATSGTSTVAPFVSLSGYHPKPVARRASIAAPGGSSLTYWRVGSSKPSVGSEVREATTTRSVYRPSSQAAYGRSAAASTVYASQVDFARSVPLSSFATRAPRAASTAVGSRSSAVSGSATPTTRGRPVYRSSSVSSFGWDDEGGYTGTAFGRAPSIRSSYSSAVGKPSTHEKTSSTKTISVKSHDFPAAVDTHPRKTTDNDIHRRKIVDYESEMERIIPLHEESLSKLRARTLMAKDHLNQHRVLLDRYLPLQLGPTTDVVGEVESRYGELLSRMPQLEQRHRSKEKDSDVTIIPPYKPAAAVTKGQKLTYEIANIPVKSSFTPKISDTRKRARSVLCKIKGDPRYFEF